MNLLLSTLLFVIVSATVHAQEPYARYLSEPGTEISTREGWPLCASALPDGGYMIGFMTSGIPDKGRSLGVMRIDSEGSVVWSRAYVVSSFYGSSPLSITPTRNGAFTLTAGTNEILICDMEPDPTGLLLLTISPDGEILRSADHYGMIKGHADRSLPIACGLITLVNYHSTPRADRFDQLAWFDHELRLLRQLSFRLADTTSWRALIGLLLTDIAADSTGGYLVTAIEDTAFTGPPSGVITRLDSVGAVVDAVTIEADHPLLPSDIETLPDGRILVVGDRWISDTSSTPFRIMLTRDLMIDPRGEHVGYAYDATAGPLLRLSDGTYMVTLQGETPWSLSWGVVDEEEKQRKTVSDAYEMLSAEGHGLGAATIGAILMSPSVHHPRTAMPIRRPKACYLPPSGLLLRTGFTAGSDGRVLTFGSDHYGTPVYLALSPLTPIPCTIPDDGSSAPTTFSLIPVSRPIAIVGFLPTPENEPGAPGTFSVVSLTQLLSPICAPVHQSALPSASKSLQVELSDW